MTQKRKISLKTAQSRYPHRYTMDHVPNWAKRPCDGNGKYYAPQYVSDQEWYDNTIFPGEKGHPLGKDHDDCCHTTNQTWPLGQWLDKQYLGYVNV